MDLSLLIIKADDITNKIISHVIIPLIILFISISAGIIVKSTVKRILNAVEFDKHAKTFLGHKIPLINIIANTLATIIYFSGTIYALKTAGLLNTIIKIISTVFLLIISISILLWLFDVISNSYARKKTSVKKGQLINIYNIRGRVIKKGLIYVRIKQKDILYDIPYKALIKTRS